MTATHTWEGSDGPAWQRVLGVPAVHLFATIGSTNDVARDLAESGAPDLTLVLADDQTQGRGRGGRRWLSAPGSSLLCSIVFRVQRTAKFTPGAAPIRIGHAVARALADAAQLDARVKWPNDVVIPGHGKVAGILCEAVVRVADSFVVAGIGINVRAPAPAPHYGALSVAAKRDVSRADVLISVIGMLKPLAGNLTVPLTDSELAALRETDILYGQLVVDDTGMSGVANGIGADGSLLIMTRFGQRAVHNATIRLAGTHDYPGARS